MENDLLCASGLSPENKIEERISFAQCHARLYLTVSYDDQDDKSAAANTFNISCGGSVCFPIFPIYVTCDNICFVPAGLLHWHIVFERWCVTA